MKQIERTLADLTEHYTDQLYRCTNLDELEAIRIAYLGRQGKVAEMMGILKTASLEEKKAVGPLLNKWKKELEHQYESKKADILHQAEQKKRVQEKYFDVTAYHSSSTHGSRHIYTQLQERLEDIFISMGFTIADGPEVETAHHNFNALNIPEEHPARDMHDTFWLTSPGFLLRTHTSPVQIRIMEQQKPPIAVFATGRCYRNEATDASHEFMFTQGEALFIDKNVSLANLLATARGFLQAFFEKKELKIRTRPGYFPFVEPGIEIDASCPFCTDGCAVCKKTGWIELLGAGLVHENVLRSCHIDPDTYSGFAIGFGLERLAMIKHGITDIRLFHNSKLAFLDQF